MWCYRRFGHNEGDEPSFTQPLMYAAIKQHPPVSARSMAPAWLPRAWSTRRGSTRNRGIRRPSWRASSRPRTAYLPNKADWFAGRWAGLSLPGEPVDATAQRRHRDQRRTLRDGPTRLLTTVPGGPRGPQDAGAHPRRQGEDARQRRGHRLGDRRGAGLRQPAAGRLSACACPARISGRGTFSQRHAVWVDQKTGRNYIPLSHQIEGGACSRCRDSPLSEFGVLGFEYGYSIADPQHAGAVGGAVRRFRQRRAGHHRPVHRRGRGASGCAPAAS